jgi:ATP-dependent exoDNAse (exonuclease V) beta subunit
MGGACTSANKNKKIKSNQKEDQKNENENEEKKEEKKESEIKKENEKELINREITFKIINKDQEFTEKVKSSEKISHLFTLIAKYKTNKNSEYDLIYDEDVSLASKLTEDIGEIFKTEENVTLNMLYMGLNVSFDDNLLNSIIDNVLSNPVFNDLGTAKIYKEYGYYDETLQTTGFIDLLYFKDNECYIVDYKSRSIDDEAYERQLRIYQRNVQLLFNINKEHMHLYLLSLSENRIKEVQPE